MFINVKYQPLPRVEFIFHNSCATVDIAVCIQTFYNVIYSEYYVKDL